jgi:hypothetical protein
LCEIKPGKSFANAHEFPTGIIGALRLKGIPRRSGNDRRGLGDFAQSDEGAARTIARAVPSASSQSVV